MDTVFSFIQICFFIVVNLRKYSAVPPDVCFEQFKWQDCGMPPKAVVYYYKSGSRCEVGMWRGCYPNPNMFVDEYECVQTCVLSIRVRAEDSHNLQQNIIEIDYEDGTTVASEFLGINATTEQSPEVETTEATDGETTAEADVPDIKSTDTDVNVEEPVDNAASVTENSPDGGTVDDAVTEAAEPTTLAEPEVEK